MLSRMTTKTPTTTTIEVTDDAKRELEAQAGSSGTTVANIVEALLARQREFDAVAEGEAQLDAGQFVAWVPFRDRMREKIAAARSRPR